MKKDSNYSLANVTSNFLKIVIHTEAHSNSTLLCHEPSAPESLTQFKKNLSPNKKGLPKFQIT